MDVPGIVREALDGEDVAATVPLADDDRLFVTATRTIAYRGEGLLSDESVEEYPHSAERIDVSEGRRSATITLDYGLDGERDLSVPAGRVDDALHPVLGGVFNARDVIDEGETLTRTYRFSELTLVVTSDRVVKHIGESVWDEDYEEVAFADVTGIDVEEGNVASQLVLHTRGRTERIKTPNEQARDVRETVEGALFDFHGVDSREEFAASVDDDAAEAAGSEADEGAVEDADVGEVSFAADDLDPVEGRDAGSREEESEDGFSDSEFQTATAASHAGREGDAAEELAALREAVERQRDLLEAQEEAIERLADRVSRDR